ncbi:hypothetical protein [Sphingobium estronivorans]|uniref:hypothetical protein n=1 Tax=Sphingobium estronivorans TaxID=1577690 RepID=UPI00123A93E0|nr:hypothetical protein [Sphingobium estronivorans]
MKSGIFIPALLLATQPSTLHAAPSPVRPFTFEALEGGYQWDGHLGSANAALVRAVPFGIPFWDALDTLEAAGARCTGDMRDPRLARCTYSARITINDYYPADAIWTVVLSQEDGKAGGLTLSRDIDER